MPELDYRAVFAASPTPYLLLSPAFTILDASEAYLRATMAERGAVVGRDVFEAFPANPEDPLAEGPRGLRASLERVLRERRPDGLPVLRYDVPIPAACGGGFEARFWKLLNAPVLGADGEVAAILHQREDVTAFVRLQADHLLAGDDDVAEARRVRDEFVDTVSHELRTPIHILMGFLDVLGRPSTGALSPRQLAYVERLREVARHLGRLVEDVLAIGQLRAGTFALQRVPLALGPLAETAVAHVGPLAEARGQRVELAAAAGLPLVYADTDRIGQVLYNLLSNAIRFSPAGSAIEVRVSAIEDAVRVEVRDPGPGIAREDVPRLFNRFTQLDMSDTRERGGVGLGLAIAKEFVEAHGGRMGVDTVLGQGSTFWFTLPRSETP